MGDERQPGDELVDLIDGDDRVVAIVTRAEMRRDNLWHRSVGILVGDSRGRVLVHRRAAHKDVWPGLWDLAVGGVVGSGEDYLAAAERELEEELGVTGTALEPLGEATFADERVRCRCRMYATVHDGPVSFPDGEIAEARWVTPAELSDLLAAAEFVPDSLAMLTRLEPQLFAGPGPSGHC